ncbi:MAG: YigZ family protein [Bacilli bacterium]|nr:YigZ family protein [Bacilli bacterium]
MIKTIKTSESAKIEIDKSVFIANIFNIKNNDEAKDIIKKIKKENYKATHNCYAYYIDDNNLKVSDDGEPSGTAGMPILGTIKSSGLSRCLIVVTRYFGGIKLGTGGLFRAYQKASLAVIEKAKTVLIDCFPHYKLVFDYNLNNVIEYFLNKNNIKIITKDYDTKISFTIYTKDPEISKKLIDITNNKINVTYLFEKEIEI